MNRYNKETCVRLLNRAFEDREEERKRVTEIIADVRARGDKALFDYEEMFDDTRLTQQTLRVSDEEFARAYEEISPELLASLRRAVENVYAYHARAGRKDCVQTDSEGRTTGYVVRPVRSAGIYVPGGTAPLASSVLMGVLPAKAAGVGRVVVTTPAKSGSVHPLVLVAAKECGADEVYKAGGAQAIAALAYGTESINKVDVIAGPGNIYVTLAKKEVYGQVGIDMLAGPSEILIVADSFADPDHVAADVLSQAEHDKLSRAIVITTDAVLAEQISARVEARLKELPRAQIARESLEKNGGIILVDSLQEACALADEVAPEHLELYVKDARELLPLIHNAGAVFLGGFTPEPVGDYFAGPNHVLPTGGSAKFFQVLNEDIFTRKMSVISYTEGALKKDGAHIVRLAESERLHAHAQAVAARLTSEEAK